MSATGRYIVRRSPTDIAHPPFLRSGEQSSPLTQKTWAKKSRSLRSRWVYSRTAPPLHSYRTATVPPPLPLAGSVLVPTVPPLGLGVVVLVRSLWGSHLDLVASVDGTAVPISSERSCGEFEHRVGDRRGAPDERPERARFLDDPTTDPTNVERHEDEGHPNSAGPLFVEPERNRGLHRYRTPPHHRRILSEDGIRIATLDVGCEHPTRLVDDSHGIFSTGSMIVVRC